MSSTASSSSLPLATLRGAGSEGPSGRSWKVCHSRAVVDGVRSHAASNASINPKTVIPTEAKAGQRAERVAAASPPRGLSAPSAQAAGTPPELPAAGTQQLRVRRAASFPNTRSRLRCSALSSARSRLARALEWRRRVLRFLERAGGVSRVAEVGVFAVSIAAQTASAFVRAAIIAGGRSRCSHGWTGCAGGCAGHDEKNLTPRGDELLVVRFRDGNARKVAVEQRGNPIRGNFGGIENENTPPCGEARPCAVRRMARGCSRDVAMPPAFTPASARAICREAAHRTRLSS